MYVVNRPLRNRPVLLLFPISSLQSSPTITHRHTCTLYMYMYYWLNSHNINYVLRNYILLQAGRSTRINTTKRKLTNTMKMTLMMMRRMMPRKSSAASRTTARAHSGILRLKPWVSDSVQTEIRHTGYWDTLWPMWDVPIVFGTKIVLKRCPISHFALNIRKRICTCSCTCICTCTCTCIYTCIYMYM